MYDDYSDYNGASHTPTNSDVPQWALNVIRTIAFIISAILILAFGSCTLAIILA